MPTYSASTSATVSFTVAASARVASAARSLAISTFVALAFPHVTYSAQSVAASVFGHDANGTKNHQWDASSVAPYTFDGAVSAGRTVNAVSNAPWSMVGTASVCTAGYGLQVIDAIQAVYSVWGAVCHADDCKSDVGEEAVNCLNAAFQRLAASGKFHVFINRVTRTLQLTGSVQGPYVPRYAIELPADVQSVESPVYLNVYPNAGFRLPDVFSPPVTKWELRPMADAASFEAFQSEYYVRPDANNKAQRQLVYLSYITNASEPSESFSGSPYSTTTVGIGRVVLKLAPYPRHYSEEGESDSDLVLQYDAILKPRRFSCQTPYERLQVPHSYVETVLFPLVKYYALTSRFFKGNAELKEAIMQQASEVLSQLTDVDPKPKEVSK